VIARGAIESTGSSEIITARAAFVAARGAGWPRQGAGTYQAVSSVRRRAGEVSSRCLSGPVIDSRGRLATSRPHPPVPAGCGARCTGVCWARLALAAKTNRAKAAALDASDRLVAAQGGRRPEDGPPLPRPATGVTLRATQSP
jgi:hypothetical protein